MYSTNGANKQKMDRSELDLIKDELIRLYGEHKTKYGSKRHAMFLSERVLDAFKEAAEICMEIGADPIDFVSAQFAAIHADQMMPVFMHGKNAKKHYQDYMEKRSMSLQELFDLQLLYLRTQILQAKRTVEEALMDDDLNFHPWFRICATKEPNQEIIDKYKEEATGQMSPRLLAFLKSKNLDYVRITNE